ncbi:MAG: DivIVA domain-containing protein [Oscillospiraceae bacterium]|jgi:cell division initiation protein|nr:DivIVA domain-containing protein [Oscillospiraceae bacterium]
MNAKEISTRKFDRGFNGYKTDEVDEFLKEISAEFSQLQVDNRDLEKKLEVLADKVREYRDDEDAIKEAMLGAQKQGNATIAEAKEKAKKIVEDAQDKADTMLADAREESKRLREEADANLKNANDEAKRIENEAAAKLEKMEEEYRNKLDLNKEILSKTKNEVMRFRQMVLEDFKRVVDIMEVLPESCENEFIAKTLTEYQKEKNVTLKKPAVKPVAEPVKQQAAVVKEEQAAEDAGDALFEEFAAQIVEKQQESTSFEVKMEEGFLADLTTEINFEPVFDEEVADETAELSAEEFPSVEKAAEAEADSGNNDPFFKKAPKEPKEREALEFGSNTKSRKK